MSIFDLFIIANYLRMLLLDATTAISQTSSNLISSRSTFDYFDLNKQVVVDIHV